MQNEQVEVQFDGMIVKLQTEEPAALFRVIKALQDAGREPEFRYYDAEIQDRTCWQPVRKAA